MNDCPSCGGSGQIQLLTSVVPCDCRRTAPKDSRKGRTFQQMREAFPPGTHTFHCSSARVTLADGRTFVLGPGRVVFSPAD